MACLERFKKEAIVMAIRQCIGWSLEALSELSRKADF